MSQATFYKWRSKFGGIDVSMMKCLKESEVEHTRLKRMCAEERLKAELARKVIEKIVEPRQLRVIAKQRKTLVLRCLIAPFVKNV